MIDMTDDVEVKLDLFEQMYIKLSVLNEHTPIIVKDVNTDKQRPWFNANLAKFIAARDRLFLFFFIFFIQLCHRSILYKRFFYYNQYIFF